MTSSQVPNGSPEASWEPADPTLLCPFGLHLDEEREPVFHRRRGGLHACFSQAPASTSSLTSFSQPGPFPEPFSE